MPIKTFEMNQFEGHVGKDLKKAADLLRSGALVGVPTETVYGLAGNALDPAATAHIFAVKRRPRFDPLIVHLRALDAVESLNMHLEGLALELARTFWPGPLTLLVPKSSRIPDLVTSGLPRVALRVPSHPMILELLAILDFPLAAPSANPFGYISPTTSEHVLNQLGSSIPYVLDGGPCRLGLESTIVGFEDGKTIVYRKGGLGLAELEAVAGPLEIRSSSSSQPAAPGMLHRHYAPKVPFVVGDLGSLLKKHAGLRTGVLSFCTDYLKNEDGMQIILSPRADTEQAARNLFSALHRFDHEFNRGRLDIVLAELMPQSGLGPAINDRLLRAASEASR